MTISDLFNQNRYKEIPSLATVEYPRDVRIRLGDEEENRVVRAAKVPSRLSLDRRRE